MLGISDYPPYPSALKAVIMLLKLKMPTVPVFNEVPSTYPNTFMIVERVGGDESAGGTVSDPMFIFQCYGLKVGDAEDLAELLLSVLKSAQFTRHGDIQFRRFTLVGGIANFPDPKIPGRRRWQFSGTFGLK